MNSGVVTADMPLTLLFSDDMKIKCNEHNIYKQHKRKVSIK